MIKALLFDVSGVLTKTDFPSFYKEVSKQIDLPEDFLQKYYKEHLQDQLVGTTTFHAVFLEAQKIIPQLEEQNFKHAYLAGLVRLTEVDENLLTIIDKLRAHYTCGVLTNNTEGRALSDEALGIYKHFDFVLQSHTSRLKKPDPAYFALGQKQAHCNADEIVYIDDQDRHAVAATEAGMHGITYIFKDTSGFLQKLDELGVQIDSQPPVTTPRII